MSGGPLGYFTMGGIGMWVLLVHLLVMLALAWGWAVAQVLSFVLWRRRMSELAVPAAARAPDALLDLLRGKKGKEPKGALGETLAMAAGAVKEGMPARDVIARANKILHHRIAAVHPARGVITAAVYVLSLLAPIALGALFHETGMNQGFAALENAFPEQKCELMDMAAKIADYPVIFGYVIVLLLVLPALASTFLQLTLLGAKRRRDDILGLVDRLCGVDVRPQAGIVPGIVSFVIILAVTAPVAWLMSGPPIVNLAAPLFVGRCMYFFDDEMTLPVIARQSPPPESDQRVLEVNTDSIRISKTVIVDLDQGAMVPEEHVKESAIVPLSTTLAEMLETRQSYCDGSSYAERCGAPMLVAVDASTPLSTASLVIGTAFRSFGGNVLVLLRNKGYETDLVTYGDMLDAVRGFSGMHCVIECPYTTLKVDDVIVGGKGSGQSRSLLDGSASGTYGDFVKNLGQDSFMVAVP